MIKVLCDRCKRELDNEKVFKVCEVHNGNTKDMAILCSSCMRKVSLDIIQLEEERAERVREIINKYKTKSGDVK